MPKKKLNTCLEGKTRENKSGKGWKAKEGH